MGFLAEDAYEMTRPLRPSGKIDTVKQLSGYLSWTIPAPNETFPRFVAKEMPLLANGSTPCG